MEWTDAIARAGDLLAPHEPTDADVIAVIALAVYVLPAGVGVDDVRRLLEGRRDIEDEPIELKDVLYAGLGAAGHIGPGDSDPVKQLLDKLAHRQEWSIGDVPLSMTCGLTRDHSRLHAALPQACALLAGSAA